MRKPRKPRIAITFDEDKYRTIKRIAELTDQPMSTMLAEMIDLAYPSFLTMLDTLEQLNKLQDTSKKKLAANLDEALKSNQEAISMLFEILNNSDDDADSQPPTSNTGVAP